jgi:hypothetical protein
VLLTPRDLSRIEYRVIFGKSVGVISVLSSRFNEWMVSFLSVRESSGVPTLSCVFAYSDVGSKRLPNVVSRSSLRFRGFVIVGAASAVMF